MARQVKSKQHLADHCEVFTTECEVEAVCDLVKQETERIDSRFLDELVWFLGQQIQYVLRGGLKNVF